MKTYAATQGKRPFNWNRFLNRKSIPKRDWKEASVRAGDWVTCACGNQCAVIPRYPSGGPTDATLYTLGVEFMYHVEEHNVERAKIALAKIEKRSGQILASMAKSAKRA